MGEWVTGSLGDLIELKRGYDLRQQLRRKGRVPIVSSSGISDFHDEAMARGPGVVTGRYGTIGIVYFIEKDFWPLNTTLYVKDFKSNDPRFVSYFLQGIDFLAYSDKAAVPGLNRNHLHTAQVRYPRDRDEQIALASVLSAFDDKIELNRRMNETLEAMARAIFRDWFVDFGPTRAKMAGREPYLAPALWSLFPDRLNETTGLPEGWEEGTMSDLFTLQRGFDLPSQNRRTGTFPILAASGPSGFHDTFMVAGPGVTTGRSGVLGRVFYTRSDFWPLNTSLWVNHYKRSTPLYAYFYLNLIDLSSFNAGSAVPTLNRNHIHGLPAVLSPVELIAAFDSFADSLMEHHRHNEDENGTLAETRDYLLPKLMSGEIRVRDAEKSIGELA